ncbi:L-aspartate oxidase [Wenjunlia tyrosinilytica]|uniref:L-aspartate oxidase n=1 Tax=Wenjunlia tyrosinilytica TaxID=1544741 RepID=A0A918DYE9_9ACTN|nr:L-aspartate oxidase [Wenjunlia tyrosinilytica]GGO88008.1 L-aspartate oxidase [Wenjunlia tyrosinilytica]
MNPAWQAYADVVVVGTGVAGLTAAVQARDCGLGVLVVTKADADDTNTRWAQGGVAVVLADSRAPHRPPDSVARHIADTLEAGAGLCVEPSVEAILADGPAAMTRLRGRGARFDLDEHGRPALAREGGHSRFRVLRAGGDATGVEVERTLLAAATDADVPVLTGHLAVEVLLAHCGAVAGLAVLDPADRLGVLRTPAVVLATGGLGRLYRATSNPAVATGDGIALALRAGAGVADLEFVQFHPTVLYTGPDAQGQCPLVTEALRGEGAVLVDGAGARLMGRHPLADLAPRDVVSAVITRRMNETGADHVYLDATHLNPKGSAFRRRFPTVHAACRAAGIDPTSEPIPVAPAAHYACGGVLTDTDGRTEVRGLYAAGEVARTGLHGANRLASNSLLEGLVVGERAAAAVAADRAIGYGRTSGPVRPMEPLTAAGRPEVIRDSMTRHAGIGRHGAGLAAALSTVEASPGPPDESPRARFEAAAMTLVARALILAAAERTESRGCHVRSDHPDRDDALWRRSQAVRLDGDTPSVSDRVRPRGTTR